MIHQYEDDMLLVHEFETLAIDIRAWADGVAKSKTIKHISMAKREEIKSIAENYLDIMIKVSVYSSIVLHELTILRNTKVERRSSRTPTRSHSAYALQISSRKHKIRLPARSSISLRRNSPKT